MSLASTAWVPGFEQQYAAAGSGGTYTDEGHPKLVWHTSETDPGSLQGIVNALLAKQHTDVYHLVADTKLRRIVQVLPLNVSASALAHPPAAETNHDGAIQVCIVGHAHDMPNLSAADLAWLGSAVLAAIWRCVPELNINNIATFYGDNAGFTLASASAPQRMPPAEWLSFNGQVGHEHVPGNDHWDPGALNVHAITLYAIATVFPHLPPPVVKVKPMVDPPFSIPNVRGWCPGIGGVGLYIVTDDGSLYCFNTKVVRGMNGKPPFAGRHASGCHVRVPGEPPGTVTIVATSSEKYTV